MRNPLIWLLFTFLWVSACGEELPGGPMNGEPDPVLEAPVTCEDNGCTATLDPNLASTWTIITWASSETIDDASIILDYNLSVDGALTKALQRSKRALQNRISAASYQNLFVAPQARISAEARIRNWPQSTVTEVVDLSSSTKNETLPFLQQSVSCTRGDTPDVCGTSALCVVPLGQMSGTCQTQIALNLRQSGTMMFANVTGVVRKVGAFGAIVVDQDDTVSEANVNELAARFEERIAPLDHQFFGLAQTNTSNEDRDGNGVVILFFSSKVSNIDPNLVGFFTRVDLPSPSETPASSSNQGEILYLVPPGGSVTLDALSGTIAHEYQHLINYYAKVLNEDSEQEQQWLDEGISSFAEDALGYGTDAFKNIAAFLLTVDETSLTGQSLLAEGDSPQRRGMAHLLVRYFFEQAGGATYGAGAADLTDAGGISAVRALVQSPDTGLDLFNLADTKRTFHDWIGDLLTAVALDGTDFKDVSTHPAFTFDAPEPDSFTGLNRGINLRGSILTGGTVLAGPTFSGDFRTEGGIPLPINAGELRTLTISSSTSISVAATDSDVDAEIRAIPLNPN